MPTCILATRVGLGVNGDHRRSLLLLPAFCLAVLTLAVGCGDDNGPAAPGPDPVADCSDPGTICTFIGNGAAGFNGDGLPLLESRLYWPIDIEFVSTGHAYVLDWNNHRVRKVENATLRTVMGTEFIGDGPDDFSDQQAPGAIGTTVHLNHPTQLIELPDGKILVTAWHNHKLRTYDPATERVLVVCGAGAGFRGDGGPSREALLSQPQCTVLGPDNDLFILDQRNQRVRRISSATGIIETVVGTGAAGFGGDGGSPKAAMINLPAGGNPPPSGAIAFDAQGRLYIADTLNQRIRRVDFASDRIETIAGTGTAGFNGDGIPATEAQLNHPKDLIVGPDGRLYVADEMNHRVRAIDLATGTIATVAGMGERGFGGDGGPAEEALLDRPTGLEFDAAGDLYIADSYNHRIRKVNL